MKKPPDGTSLHYCVLDDEPTFLEVAREALSRFLPQLSGLFTGEPEKAVEAARRNPRMTFIIDVRLGIHNGIEVFNDIVRVSPRARVIFITGDTKLIEDEGLRERALSRGGIDFISKPIKWHELAIKVQNHLKLVEYQYELEEKVEERTRMLIHADRLATVGTMVSSIVHEVNSPLTFIKANQELSMLAIDRIDERCDDPEVKRMIHETIRPGFADSIKGVRQIEVLLRSFRRFYKQEKSQTAVDIMDIIDDVRMLTVHNLRKQQVTMSISNHIAGSLEAWANKQELTQALLNIVNNAIDAFEDSTVKQRRIELKLEKRDTNLELTLSNNGPDIPPDIAENIFEPFFTTKPEDRGTGLGLAIVKQILRGMGGDIEMRNKIDERRMVDFVCTIPLYREHTKQQRL